MKPEDQKAFDEALVNRCKTVLTVPQDFEAGWNEALAHRDAQPAGAQDELAAVIVLGGVDHGEFEENDIEWFGRFKDLEGLQEELVRTKSVPIELYARNSTSAVAVNERLLGALNAISDRASDLVNMNENRAASVASELGEMAADAIAAAEAAKGGV